MLGSYIKTSGRNLLRNRLFSAINIIGLAISMSVGLLLIAIISDLKSYDQFHNKKDRIYRVASTWTDQEEDPWKYASTSIKAGKIIKDNMAGAERVSITRRAFRGDARYGDKVLPFWGNWADNEFLKIFTFPLKEGDVNTALKEPYSIVLTEKSAAKLFGDEPALGKIIQLDTLNYTVTGILFDIPHFSYLQFEALGSFSTFELINQNNPRHYTWTNIWMNYVYVLLPEDGEPNKLQANLNNISTTESDAYEFINVDLWLQPLENFVLGESLSNADGANVDPNMLWVLGALAFIVMLSASFNYTNLSIARSIKRSREVGVRKVIGANRSNVIWQFLSESVIISLLALFLSAGIFILLRTQFMTLVPDFNNIVTLEIGTRVMLAFLAMATLLGLISGIMPALFFSKVNPVKVLKGFTSNKAFRHLNFRKGLIAIQYIVSLVFITLTIVGYKQYQHSVAFDLGFNTENILNIRLQGNNPATLRKKFSELPEVTSISGSNLVPSIGNFWSENLKYKNPEDSIYVNYLLVDENYVPIHDHEILAGRNFTNRIGGFQESEVIVNEKVLERFDIANQNPAEAIGEVMLLDGQEVTIIGVMEDFHYGKVNNQILPVLFRYHNDESGYADGFINLQVSTMDILGTMAKIENAWKSIDNIHQLDAKFYKEQIEEAYSDYSAMVKVIGYLSVLAITIASMGLLGMVVFTTESRQKEIGIRKAMGAGIPGIILLLSKNFLVLLGISAAIALPATYLFVMNVMFSDIVYSANIGILEIISGLGIVGMIALLMIGSQSYKIAKVNPAVVLKNE